MPDFTRRAADHSLHKSAGFACVKDKCEKKKEFRLVRFCARCERDPRAVLYARRPVS